MKKHYIILGLFCLLAIVACSDNDPVVEVNNGNQTEELPRPASLPLAPPRPASPATPRLTLLAPPGPA